MALDDRWKKQNLDTWKIIIDKSILFGQHSTAVLTYKTLPLFDRNSVVKFIPKSNKTVKYSWNYERLIVISGHRTRSRECVTNGLFYCGDPTCSGESIWFVPTECHQSREMVATNRHDLLVTKSFSVPMVISIYRILNVILNRLLKFISDKYQRLFSAVIWQNGSNALRFISRKTHLKISSLRTDLKRHFKLFNHEWNFLQRVVRYLWLFWLSFIIAPQREVSWMRKFPVSLF